jgi:hypothetical protein
MWLSKPSTGRGLHDVQRLARRHAAEHVEHHDVAQLLQADQVGEGAADVAGADEGDLLAGHEESLGGLCRRCVALGGSAGKIAPRPPGPPDVSQCPVDYSGTQRTTLVWPMAMVAMVPSGQLDCAMVGLPRSLPQRRATLRVAPEVQTRRPLRMVQLAIADWR